MVRPATVDFAPPESRHRLGRSACPLAKSRKGNRSGAIGLSAAMSGRCKLPRSRSSGGDDARDAPEFARRYLARVMLGHVFANSGRISCEGPDERRNS
jgi:hypothetical protein